ncbi:lysozyme inhibitor LprI family protein [Propionivibrio sp.]|uniref:lysozyme inhibitor LprI family protein n=1 Tax=Propionivibrio sp. TaxID=2212460 RepID=UPI003BEFFAFC
MILKIILIVVALVESATVMAADLPKCNTEQVMNMLVDSRARYYKQYPIVYGDIRILAMTPVRELGVDLTQRACEATEKNSRGDLPVGYVIEWRDRNNGLFIVSNKLLDTLKASYGISAPVPTTVSKPVVQAHVAAPLAPAAQPAPALADSMLSGTYNACMKEAVSMPDMTDCAAGEAALQDKRLNVAWKVAIANTADKVVLRSAQRQWIKARDKQCAMVGDSGGQNDALVAADCVASFTAKRAKELETIK